MKYDVVIIGSGLGGLQCGYILAKKGMHVCVLERATILGGCIQSFMRKGQTYDTGFHYVGGLDEGQPLHTLFSFYDLLGLNWEKMDPLFDEVNINGRSFFFAQGHEAFYQTLAAEFPHQKENLQKYLSVLKNVGDHIFDSLQPRDIDQFYSTSLFAQSAKAFLDETITDPLLRDVLAGCSLKMELTPNLPLYTFAQINNSFIQSAWRLQGGGSTLAKKLAESIEQMGGTVRTRAAVTELIEQDGKLVAAMVNNEERIEADWFISNAHPVHTLTLVKESELIRKIYRRRINNLSNTYGTFTANLLIKPDAIPYIGRNQYVYQNADLWQYTPGQTDRVLVSYYKPAQGDSIAQLDLLTPMSWAEVEQWASKPIGRRGDDYVAMKNQKTTQCVDLVKSVLPQLKDSIEAVFTSTPISYQTYTNTHEGSSFGIQKDFNSTMTTVLTPKTPIPNLLLTGQNLNLHGILGVSMTSCFTCAEIIGMNSIVESLKSVQGERRSRNGH
jgi:all-trans-retinol 13,14-reductase